jgi:4-amino-4-deoxy-L-arabinose transferase-like glycosyltransferase
MLVALLCIALPHVLVMDALSPIITNDSIWYLDQTHTWDSPRPADYYAANGAPVAYALAYPPGYPLFLDLCHLFVSTRSWAVAVVVAQHVLSLLAALAVYGIGRELGHPRAGCVAAAAYGLYFPRLLYAQTLHSETLFTFLLVAAVYLTFVSLKAGVVIRTITGLAFAGAMLTKFQAVAGLPLVLLLYGHARARPVQAGAFLAAALLPVGVALAHNLVFYGQPALTTFAGKHLANRVFGTDGLIDPVDPDTRYILDTAAQSGIDYAFPGAWWQFERALRSDGSTSAEADRRVRAAALAAIRTDPVRYARNTASTLFVNVFFHDDFDRNLWWDPAKPAHVPERVPPDSRGTSPPLETEAKLRVLEAVARPPAPQRLGSVGIGWVHLFASPWLEWRGYAAWLLVAGILCALVSGVPGLVFLVALIGGVSVPGALFEQPVPRYFEPLIPLALLVSCIALPMQLRERSIGRWLLLAALLLAIAALGRLFEPSVERYLWPAGPAAALAAGALLWRTTRLGHAATRGGLGAPVSALAVLMGSLAVSWPLPESGPVVPATATGGAKVVQWIPRSRLLGARGLAPGAHVEGPLPRGGRFSGTVIDVRPDHVSIQLEPTP